MTQSCFEFIHSRIEHHLLPKRDVRPDKIKTRERLAMVLEYLRSGSSQMTIADLYRVGQSTVCKSIDIVCNAICEEFQTVAFENYDREIWLNVANRFNERWNLPNCLGAIDGKHIRIKCPSGGGSLFYNFKVRTACSKNIQLAKKI